MNRILKFFFFGIVLIILILAGFVLYTANNFAKLDFTDSFPVTNDYTGYFPVSHESSRENFFEITEDLLNEYVNVQIFSVKVPSETDEELAIDICYIPAQVDSTNLLILSSGVHGVEGFAGHAAQLLFLKQFLNLQLLQNTGVLLIHNFNPYGFKYYRRVTENNVDLNRNSTTDQQLYKTENKGYPEVYGLINPQKKVNMRAADNRFFFLKAINAIRKVSMPVLRQAVLQGQYTFPEGLYFGGFEPEPQIESILPVFKKISSPYQRILAIDFHTGYGERGKLHFFPNPVDDSKRIKMEGLFEGYSIDWGDTDDFYTVTGDFTGFLEAASPDKEFFPMTFEYGTLNSQTTLGSLKSIHVMILENQGRHFGYVTEKDSLYVREQFIEMYNPESDSWRNYIMEQTLDVFQNVIPRFVEMK